MALLGVALTVTGSFLTWVLSGRVGKNSYQVAGSLDRYFPGLNGPGQLAVSSWPFQGPAWAVAAVLYILGLRRTGAALGAALALLAATVAILALSYGGDLNNRFLSLDPTGPITTLIGSAIVLAGCGLVIFSARTGSKRANSPSVGQF